MTDTIEYALMAGAAYHDTRNDANRIPYPDGWSELEYGLNHRVNLLSGFEGVAFVKEKNIVISFAGTYPGVQDFGADIFLGAGVVEGQLLGAALYYKDIKNTYPESDGYYYTFTGHSLGGGLAALMGVFFDKAAVTFDPAPFRASATMLNALTIASDLLVAGYGVDTGLATFYAVAPGGVALPSYIRGESKVTATAVSGEFLSVPFLEKLRIRSGVTDFLEHGNVDQGGVAGMAGFGMDVLHAQTLLIALKQSSSFKTATFAMPYLIPDLFDENLFAKPGDSPVQDLLSLLVRREFGVPGKNISGTDLLTKFGKDMLALATNGTAENDIKQTLERIAFAAYYQAGSGPFDNEFFDKVRGGLSFDMTTLTTLSNAEPDYFKLQDWLISKAPGEASAEIRSYLADFHRTTIALDKTANAEFPLDDKTDFMFSGANGGSLAGGGGDDLLVGRGGVDTLNGGSGNDKLYGGAGADTLIGGEGDDILNGGEGNDTYIWDEGDGHDQISDSDGKGCIVIQSQGKSLSACGIFTETAAGSGTWTNPDGTLTLTNNGAWKLATPSGGQIELIGFSDGNFGIHLNAASSAPTYDKIVAGDISPTDIDPGLAGIQAEGDILSNPIGTAQPYEDILLGSAGNDHILSGALNDDVDAGAGDDWVEGGGGSDYIMGRAGNDLVEGGAGSDILEGDEGDDLLYGNVRIDIAAAIANADSATGLKGDWLSGGTGDDTLVAGADDDVLAGGAGSDLLIAGAGNDNILGDASYTAQYQWEDAPRYSVGNTSWYHSSADTYNWTITPGPDTTLFAPVEGETSPAGGAADVIYAGAGNDHVWAGEGDDTVMGEDGNDFLAGEAGNDVLLGGSGDDTLSGDSSDENAGNDYLDGEDGNDTLYGAAGRDMLYGGAGNDRLYGDSNNTAIDRQGDDYLDGGAGDDMLLGAGGADTLFGGDGADFLQGDSGTGIGDGDDYLNGENGNDTLLGEGGNDELFGGLGDDTLAGGDGADMLAGGDGNDVLFGQEGDDTLDGGAGSDQLRGNGGNDIIGGGDGDDLLLGDEGGDHLSGDAGNDELQGGDGDDYLDGSDGNDVLFGDSGNDTLVGGAGNDTLLGGTGDDILDGGDGDDIYYISAFEGNDHIVDSGGTDWLVLQNINWGDIQLGVGSLKLTVKSTGQEIHLDDFDPDNPLGAGGIEYFQFADGTVKTKTQLVQALGFIPTGTPGDDTLSGTALDDTIFALEGNDVVTARAGNDSVYLDAGDDYADAGDGDDSVWAGDGNDIVVGGNGADWLDGGLGDDILAGNAGNDTLEGREGNDTYLFGPGDGLDVVIDSAGIDTVQLTGLSEAQVNLLRLGSDLIVAVKDAADELTVKDWFGPAGNFQRLILGDGSVLERTAVEERLLRNQAPLASEDVVAASEDGIIQLSGNALANDVDPEGRVLRVTSPGVYAGNYGTLSIDSGGAFAYALDNNAPTVQGLAAGQTVSERFAYTLTDDDPNGAAVSSSAIVVTIAGTNDTPVVVGDRTVVAEDGMLFATGNVLANDSDVDSGSVLRVSSPGTIVSAYGSATLAADGSYTYALDNASAAVQSLGRDRLLTERFDYTVSDGIASVDATLEVNISGSNDAPIVAAALADQAVSVNTAYSWQIPKNSFADPDYGDVLAFGASLADGSALPAWLVFDAATQTFSGRVPKTATGSLDVCVTATDGNAGQAGNLSASDVFRLSFAGNGGSGGNGGNAGGKEKGNEGVGNGVDAPPPGHDYSFNDGAGSSPGHPGAQGGNGFRPGLVVARADFQVGTPLSRQVDAIASAHGQGMGTDKGLHVGSPAAPVPDATASTNAAASDGLARAKGQDGSPDNACCTPFANGGKTYYAWQEPSYLDPAKIHGADTHGGAQAATADTGVENVLAQWMAMDEQLAAHLATNDEAVLSSGPESGMGMMGASAFLGSSTIFSDDPLSLSSGNGNSLKPLQGLKEGFRQAA